MATVPFVCPAFQRKGLPFPYRVGSFYSFESGPAICHIRNPLKTKGGLFVFFVFRLTLLNLDGIVNTPEEDLGKPKELGW